MTKAVWTYDKKLTCCAMSLVHGIADTSPCPCTLKSYVASNLKSWFESTYDDKCIHQDGDYFLGEEDSQKQGEIIIMDKDTDVEQNSTKMKQEFAHLFAA